MRRHLIVLLAAALPIAAHASNCNWQGGPTDVTLTTTYDVFGSGNITVPQNFAFHCTPNTAATITLSRGTNSAAYSPWRTMKITNPPAGYAGTLLNYNIWTPANAPSPTPANAIWGDGTGNSIKVNWTSSSSDKIYDYRDGATFLYVLPLGSDVPPGTYDDTLTASLSWSGGVPDTTTWRVIVTILPQCKVDAFSVAFGSYDPVAANLTAPKDATGTVNVRCTKSTSATVTLDPGKWSFSGSRRMQEQTATSLYLPYDIYTDTGRSTIWNTTNTNTGTSTSKLTPIGPGTGGFTAFGRIQPNLDVSAGTYKDTVQAVVNY